MKRVSRVSPSGHDNPGVELSKVRMLILLCLCVTIVCSTQEPLKYLPRSYKIQSVIISLFFSFF